MKKIISFALCLCMLLSMALSVGAAEAGKPVYVALGDEIALGADLNEGERNFAQIVADKLGYELVNFAQDGMTMQALQEQVNSGDITEELASAELITITCIIHDTLNLVFAKTLASYNEANDPDLTYDEMMTILKAMDPNDSRFQNLLFIANNVFNEGYLESEEFEQAITTSLAQADAIMAAIRQINPTAEIVITNQYNPYKNVGGVFMMISSRLEQGVVKANAILDTTGYNVADVYTPFNESTVNLCNASLNPRNPEFTPNAAGHAVMAEAILKALPVVNPFVDVAAGEYYFDPVMWAVANGITAGTSADRFSPDQDCTRAQVVTFLWRAAGKPEPTTTVNTFVDVVETDYFYKAVLWAVENGITLGTGNGKFSPEQPCTRAQVVTFLWRANGTPAPSTTENPFGDVPAGEYYFNPVLWAVENKITAGTGAGKFSPEDTCTRAQIVTFLYRALAN